jgi:hypothetical protein
MDIAGIMSVIGRPLAAGAIFVGLPVMLIGVARYGIRQVVAPEYIQIPLLIKLTVTAGLILGVGLLAAVARPDYYHVEQVLGVGGPWDLSIGEFLRYRVNPLRLDLGAVIDALRFDDPRGNLAILFATPAILTAIMIIACFGYWQPLAAAICALVSLGAIVIIAYVVFYLVCGALWIANLFNFWALLIIMLMYQWRRHAL